MWFRRTASVLTVASCVFLVGCSSIADSARNALGGSNSTSTSNESGDGSSSSSKSSSGKESSSRSASRSADRDEPAEPIRPARGKDDIPELTKPPEDRKIFRNSRQWRDLETPGNVRPGAKYYVKRANGDIGFCSFGWWVRDKEDKSRHYNLTAGHCGEKGDRVFIRTKEDRMIEVGRFVWSEHPSDKELGTSPDQGLIELTIDPKYVSGTPTIKDIELHGWAETRWLEDNNPYICRLGWRSGLSCGQYQEMINEHNFYYDNIQDHGDSGGAVWAYHPEDNTKILAVGVASHGSDADATRAGAAAIAPTLERFNLTILK